MANINVILDDLKRVIADLTVDNSILKAEIAERDQTINELKQELEDKNTNAVPEEGTGRG